MTEHEVDWSDVDVSTLAPAQVAWGRRWITQRIETVKADAKRDAAAAKRIAWAHQRELTDLENMRRRLDVKETTT